MQTASYYRYREEQGRGGTCVASVFILLLYTSSHLAPVAVLVGVFI